MQLSDRIAAGALAISGAILAVIDAHWPGFIGPWFMVLAAVATAHAALGIGWDEDDPLLYRLASTHSLLLLPIFFPVAWLMAFFFMKDEDLDDE